MRRWIWTSVTAAGVLGLFVFQNCGRMRAATFTATSVLGKNGEHITGFSPTLIYGAGQIQIHGSGFSDLTTVQIGTQDCASLVLNSSSLITCVLPSGLHGQQEIAVAGMVLGQPLTFESFAQVETVAGRDGFADVVDGVNHLARLGMVGGMAMIGNTLYFTEYKGNVIRQMDMTTYNVTTVSGTPDIAGGFADGDSSQALYLNPMGLAAAGGMIYIADSSNCALRVFDPVTRKTSTLIGGPASGGQCPSPVDGAFATARLSSPTVLTADGEGALYVSETDTHGVVIRKIDLTAQTITTVAGDVTRKLDFFAGPYWAPKASDLTQSFVLPTPMESGHPYVASSAALSITPPALAGPVQAFRVHFTQLQLEVNDSITFAGPDGSSYFTLKGNMGTDFWSPVIPGGTVTVNLTFSSGSTKYGYKVDQIEYMTATPTLWVNSTDADQAHAAVGTVAGMAVINGALYFSDQDAHAVRKVDLVSRAVTAVAGFPEDQTYAVGTYWTVRMDYPTGIVSDGQSLYVTDFSDERVLAIDLTTRDVRVLLASDPSAGSPSNMDGPLATAAVLNPNMLIMDPVRGLWLDCYDIIRLIH